ncbi:MULTISPECIES: hypothetical protein [unclassified Shewanella]|uniref:hypothetical protein n=1 Tax=unclassified Shewanella TaxID=196818 RepID=UPI000C821529|nr:MULTISPECIES: hypothetical protein [unclassified Shewanella]PMG51081.1 hypothetical protein BCU91_16940 [Shewanella sp. 10N.286.52.B9]PMG74977.1 hypothetical protein BCU84_16815 [Shewanella sp. 10N.286.51.B7]
MATFSKEQISFIEWLSKGNHIEVCIEICPDLGKMTGYESFSGSFQKRTLFKLKQQGFLAESTRNDMGMKWQKCSLNQRGYQWLKQHGGLKNA